MNDTQKLTLLHKINAYRTQDMSWRKISKELGKSEKFAYVFWNRNKALLDNPPPNGETNISAPTVSPLPLHPPPTLTSFMNILSAQQQRFDEIYAENKGLKDANLKLARVNDELISFRKQFFQCEICQNWYDWQLHETHHDGIAQGRTNLPDLPFIDWDQAKENTTRRSCIFCHPQTAASILRKLTKWQRDKVERFKSSSNQRSDKED